MRVFLRSVPHVKAWFDLVCIRARLERLREKAIWSQRGEQLENLRRRMGRLCCSSMFRVWALYQGPALAGPLRLENDRGL
jgi:hypothetical protein